MNEYKREVSRWEAEVEREAAELIRCGYSPWEALDEASRRVRLRREVTRRPLRREDS